jgi:hypothetical protein
MRRLGLWLLRLLPLAAVVPQASAFACSCASTGPWSYEETLASASLELEVTILKPVVAGDATDGHGFREVGVEARVDKVTKGTWAEETIRLFSATSCGPRGVDFAPGSRWAVIPVLPGRQKHVSWKRRGMPDFDAYLHGTCGKWFRPL